MKKTMIVALSFFVISPNTLAIAVDHSASSLNECQSLKDDSKRLQCFDSLPKSTDNQEPDGLQEGLPEGDVGEWSINKVQSKIDDSWNVFVSLNSTDTIRTRFGEQVYPSLNAMCREGKTYIYVDWGQFLGTNEIPMIQRIDSEKATQKTMLLSTDSKSVFYQGNAITFAKKLMDSKKVFLRVTPYGENSVDATFNLAGLSEAIKPLRHECKW